MSSEVIWNRRALQIVLASFAVTLVSLLLLAAVEGLELSGIAVLGLGSSSRFWQLSLYVVEIFLSLIVSRVLLSLWTQVRSIEETEGLYGKFLIAIGFGVILGVSIFVLVNSLPSFIPSKEPLPQQFHSVGNAVRNAVWNVVETCFLEDGDPSRNYPLALFYPTPWETLYSLVNVMCKGIPCVAPPVSPYSPSLSEYLYIYLYGIMSLWTPSTFRFVQTFGSNLTFMMMLLSWFPWIILIGMTIALFVMWFRSAVDVRYRELSNIYMEYFIENLRGLGSALVSRGMGGRRTYAYFFTSLGVTIVIAIIFMVFEDSIIANDTLFLALQIAEVTFAIVTTIIFGVLLTANIIPAVLRRTEWFEDQLGDGSYYVQALFISLIMTLVITPLIILYLTTINSVITNATFYKILLYTNPNYIGELKKGIEIMRSSMIVVQTMEALVALAIVSPLSVVAFFSFIEASVHGTHAQRIITWRDKVISIGLPTTSIVIIVLGILLLSAAFLALTFFTLWRIEFYKANLSIYVNFNTFFTLTFWTSITLPFSTAFVAFLTMYGMKIDEELFKNKDYTFWAAAFILPFGCRANEYCSVKAVSVMSTTSSFYMFLALFVLAYSVNDLAPIHLGSWFNLFVSLLVPIALSGSIYYIMKLLDVNEEPCEDITSVCKEETRDYHLMVPNEVLVVGLGAQGRAALHAIVSQHLYDDIIDTEIAPYRAPLVYESIRSFVRLSAPEKYRECRLHHIPIVKSVIGIDKDPNKHITVCSVQQGDMELAMIPISPSDTLIYSLSPDVKTGNYYDVMFMHIAFLIPSLIADVKSRDVFNAMHMPRTVLVNMIPDQNTTMEMLDRFMESLPLASGGVMKIIHLDEGMIGGRRTTLAAPIIKVISRNIDPMIDRIQRRVRWGSSAGPRGNLSIREEEDVAIVNVMYDFIRGWEVATEIAKEIV